MAEMHGGLNLVLLGKIGAGKSASGNTILGQQTFESKKSLRSVTQHVSVESGTVNGFPVTVYDTPGLINTDMSEEENLHIYEDILQKCEFGTCAFLLVIKAGRFTEKERRTVEKIEKLLGETRLKNTWILFTGGDELEDENMTINEFLDESEPLKNLVHKYDQRYHVFNNKKKAYSTQVQMLLVKILEKMKYFDTMEVPEIRKQNPTGSSPPPRRIVLLGQTGVGKSATGNTILGQKEFRSMMKFSLVTHECSVKQTSLSGRSVLVVDTPGFFNTQMSPEELKIEIGRSVYLSSPGPHAFLIVFSVNMRITEHEQQIPQMIEMLFGQEVLKYSIILFTLGDWLDDNSIKEIIKENRRLRHLVDQCGGRYQVFNNRNLNSREQVNDLLQKIDSMIEQNGGGYYSSQMFQDAQRLRREEEEEQRKGEKEKRRKEEEHRMEMEMMRRKMDGMEMKRNAKEEKETEKSSGFKVFLTRHKHFFWTAALAPVVAAPVVVVIAAAGAGAAAAAAVGAGVAAAAAAAVGAADALRRQRREEERK